MDSNIAAYLWRFVCDEQPDILLGRSPIDDLWGPQEAVNTILSSITTNAIGYGVQYVAVEAGTELDPRTLGEGGMKILDIRPVILEDRQPEPT